ncbi:MAG: acyl-CoA thioesterase [Clostridia bacterium]|nr:acyl-CoA thioesterase [Clostridia bacterium]
MEQTGTSKNSLPGKSVSASRTEQVQILTYGSMNGYNRLFGGQLMEWIDVVACVTARRHCGCNVTTAAVDSLEFTAPALVNDTVILHGYITYAGRTSMEICVRTYVEHLDGARTEINKAHLVIVAIDGDGNPVPVPPVIPETDEEKREFREAITRRQYRDMKRLEFN